MATRLTCLWRLRLPGVLSLFLGAAAVLSGTVHAADLSTRHGRFVNLVRMLADSGRLDEPEETGRLLRTRFRPEGSSEHREENPRICVGEPPNERWPRSTITTNYIPDAPFWFTDEIRRAGSQPGDGFSYTVEQTTTCEGVRYMQAKISFSGVFRLFCVHVEDVLAASITGLKGGVPYPDDPNWGLYWNAWISEETGTRAILDWDHTGSVSDHGECLRDVILRQEPAFSARVRRLSERMQNNAPLLGPGSGKAIDALPN